MTFTFECLTTISGKCLVLSIDNQKYLFNCFEGFQRYCIEAKIKLKQVNTIFLPTKESVIPFLGAFLTLGDMGKENINVVTRHEEIFIHSKNFANRIQLQIAFHNNSFEDINLKVTNIKDGIYQNNILNIKPIRGKFNIKKAKYHKIPKEEWKSLCQGEDIYVGNQSYSGNDFLSEGHIFEKIAIVYNEDDVNYFDEYEGCKIVFCFYPKTALSLSMKLDAQFYILGVNNAIEFGSLYKILKALNGIYSNFHVPSGNKIDSINSLCLYTNDQLYYSKKKKEICLDVAVNELYTPVDHRIDSSYNIIFLGTGAAIPSKYRNVSSILVQHKETYVVLDVGEDTYFNILRFYGNDKIIPLIDCIFISHSHADHHLGSAKLIAEILKSRDSIKVICPSVVKNFIDLFVTKGIDYYLTDSIERPKLNGAFTDPEKHIMKLDFGYDVLVTPVFHCNDSCGIRFNFDDFSLSYSGDCRPSFLFGFLSNKCDVMIHEATFDDDLLSKALKTKHSTISEAINIFNQSKAKKLILTHFSQRYPRNINYPNILLPAFDFFRYDVFNFNDTLFQKCLEYLAGLDE